MVPWEPIQNNSEYYVLATMREMWLTGKTFDDYIGITKCHLEQNPSGCSYSQTYRPGYWATFLAIYWLFVESGILTYKESKHICTFDHVKHQLFNHGLSHKDLGYYKKIWPGAKDKFKEKLKLFHSLDLPYWKNFADTLNKWCFVERTVGHPGPEEVFRQFIKISNKLCPNGVESGVVDNVDVTTRCLSHPPADKWQFGL